MQNYISSEKDLDNTISKIANILCEVFKLPSEGIPPFIALINPNTRCFHYYGKKYYNTLISSSNEKKQRINKVIIEVFEKINTGKIREFYDEDKLIFKVESYLNEKLRSDDKAIEIFINLLLKTPISRNYGVIGQCYNTNISRVFHNENQNKYSGAEEYTEDDPILGGKENQNLFKEIIESLEKVFWEERIVRSAIMIPLILNGKILGATFIGDEKENSFTYYDYIRFVKLAGEMSVTLLKDAKQYEFISDVIKYLPDKNFNIVNAVFENLNILFNISGACLSYEKICSRLIFTKNTAADVLPNWKVKECKDCCFFSIEEEEKEIISDNKFCEKIVNANDDLLKYKSGLYIDKPHIGAKFVIYFDVVKEILNIHKEAIRLEIENALELTNLIENNLEFFKSYEHDTGRFVDNIKLNNNIASIIKNNGTLISKMLGGKIINNDISELTNQQIRKKINNLFRLTQKAKINPNIKIKKQIRIKVGNVINCFWPSLETILQNLMINTFLKTKTSDSKIIVNLSTENNYLVLNYRQIGCNFDKDAESVKLWLNGKYDKTNLCGFGHYIIQKTVDRFNGTLVIQLKKEDKVYTIKKDQPIYVNERNSEDRREELCYIAHLTEIYKESK